jgi:hypothetical protein
MSVYPALKSRGCIHEPPGGTNALFLRNFFLRPTAEMLAVFHRVCKGIF